MANYGNSTASGSGNGTDKVSYRTVSVSNVLIGTALTAALACFAGPVNQIGFDTPVVGIQFGWNIQGDHLVSAFRKHLGALNSESRSGWRAHSLDKPVPTMADAEMREYNLFAARQGWKIGNIEHKSISGMNWGDLEKFDPNGTFAPQSFITPAKTKTAPELNAG